MPKNKKDKKEPSAKSKDMVSREYVAKIAEDNLRLTQEVHELTKRINRYILFAQIMGVIKLLVILAPIILAIIYLPPLWDGLVEDIEKFLPNRNTFSPSDVKEYFDQK